MAQRAIPPAPKPTAPGTTAGAARSRDARHTTISASFSFTIPETWRPKGGIVRWINDLPGPRAREEPLQPSSLVRGEKYDINMVNKENIPAGDDEHYHHRDKRARRVSTITFTEPKEQAAPEPQPQQQAGVFARGHRRAVESISSMFSRKTSVRKHKTRQQQQQQDNNTNDNDQDPAKELRSETPASNYTVIRHHIDDDNDDSESHVRHQERHIREDFSSRRASTATMAGTTARGSVVSNSPPGTPFTVPGRPRMRFAFVGDSGCGKSSLLLRYYRDTFTEAHIPTQYELFTKTTLVDGQDVELELWDTSGDIALHQLELLSYMTWDAVFLCFSVTSQKQFDRTQTQWLKEIRMNCRDAPVILVGCKKDLHSAEAAPSLGIWEPLYQHNPSLSSPPPFAAVSSPTARPSSGALLSSRHVAATEACLAAHASGLIRYMECSAYSGAGVTDVLHQGVRTVFDERAADEEALRMNMQCCGGGRKSLLRRRLRMGSGSGSNAARRESRRGSGASRKTVQGGSGGGGDLGMYEEGEKGGNGGGIGDIGTGVGRLFCFT